MCTRRKIKKRKSTYVYAYEVRSIIYTPCKIRSYFARTKFCLSCNKSLLCTLSLPSSFSGFLPVVLFRFSLTFSLTNYCYYHFHPTLHHYLCIFCIWFFFLLLSYYYFDTFYRLKGPQDDSL